MDKNAVFKEKLRALIREKGHNGTIFPTSQQDQMITDILQIQSDGPKSARDYNLKNRYGFLKIGEENKLIRLGKNDAIRCIASIEEMFDVINDAHQKIGHGGEKKHFEKHKINGRTSHKKLAICFSHFVKNATRRGPESFQKA
ncbi:KRAB-A domain-containing protein 2 [Trichinella sp. T9]|nr:KRAB-A domain-containing protein 2 [Trichinella sp. T9]